MKESGKSVEELEDKIKQAEGVKADKEKQISKLNAVIEEKEADIDNHSNKAKKLAELNEELRQLFEEERAAMAEETEKLEFEMDHLHH